MCAFTCVNGSMEGYFWEKARRFGLGLAEAGGWGFCAGTFLGLLSSLHLEGEVWLILTRIATDEYGSRFRVYNLWWCLCS